MAAMVDFDKYRMQGAYHWEYMDSNPEYLVRVMAVCTGVCRSSRVLDLGCGDGAYLSEVADRCRYVVGVDGDPDGIRCAEEMLFRARIRNAFTVQSTFEELPERMPRRFRRFDLIYSMDCIEHLLDPEELLETMDRYLAAGGEIMIGTPLFRDEESVSTYHVKEYTREELLGMLAPRFEMIRERFLPARRPGCSGLEPRFYFFHGRRRRRWTFWKSF